MSTGLTPGEPAASVKNPLVSRLETLEWPTPSPEARDRCLELLKAQLEERDGELNPARVDPWSS